MTFPIVTGDELLQKRLERWCAENKNLGELIKTNAAKFTTKFRRAKDREGKEDVLAEIEVARLLLKQTSEIGICFEPYGICEAGPDLQITIDGERSNIEVKRIVPTPAILEIQTFLERLQSRLKSVESSLGFYVSLVIDQANSGLLGQGETQTIDLLLEQIREHGMQQFEVFEAALLSAKTKLSGNEEFEVASPLINGLKVTFVSVPGKQPNLPTSNFGSSYPLPYKNNECFKYSDNILNCLRQCRGDLPNVLLIMNSSETHHAEELHDGLKYLSKKCETGDDAYFIGKPRYGLKSVADFQTKIKNLTAIYINPSSGRKSSLWINPEASHPLSQKMQDLFFASTATLVSIPRSP